MESIKNKINTQYITRIIIIILFILCIYLLYNRYYKHQSSCSYFDDDGEVDTDFVENMVEKLKKLQEKNLNEK